MTEKNEIFNVTGEHPIWLQGKGWTQAKDIKRADPIATQTGDILVLQNTRINQPLKVYNFSVANTPNYFVGTQGIWVHNAGGECDIYGGSSNSIADLFKSGRVPKASELKEFAEQQGWESSQTTNGPLKYIDENGINRLTIKQGSSRAPGSAGPHVELRNATGQRVDPEGNPVTRTSTENHTPIVFDL